MLSYIILIIVLVSFFLKFEYQLILYTLLKITIPDSIIIPGLVFMPITRFMLLSILLQFFIKYKINQIFFEIKKEKILQMISFIIIYLLINYILNINNEVRLFEVLSTIIEDLLLFIIYYISFKDIKIIKTYYRAILITMSIVVVYGTFEYITGLNPFASIVSQSSAKNSIIGQHYTLLSSQFDNKIRSIYWHSVVYSFFLLMLIPLLFISFSNERRKTRKLIISIFLFLSIFNFAIVNSRSAYLGFVVMIFFYFFLLRDVKKTFFIFFFLILATVIFIDTFSLFKDDLFSVVFLWNDSYAVSGRSSVNMRFEQLNGAISYFSKSPIIGNGIGTASYLNSTQIDNSLRGNESFMIKLLIDQGLIGIILYAAFFISILKEFYKYYKIIGTKFVFYGGLTGFVMTLAYIVFIFGTGEMGTFTFFFMLIAPSLKMNKLYYLLKFKTTN